ncbi:MAG: hypothetical protein ACR2RA_12520, partial [Geminicoccaceae bacterium]
MAANENESSTNMGDKDQANDAERIDQLWRNRNTQANQKDVQDSRLAPDVPSQHLGTNVQGSHVESDDNQNAPTADPIESEGHSEREQAGLASEEADGLSFDGSMSTSETVAPTDGHVAAAGEGLRFDAVEAGASGRPPLSDGIDPNLVDAGDDADEAETSDAANQADAAAGPDMFGPPPPPTESVDPNAGNGGTGGGIGVDLPIEPEAPVNFAPEDLALSSGGAVLENAAAGTVVAQITGSDPDAGDVL